MSAPCARPTASLNRHFTLSSRTCHSTLAAAVTKSNHLSIGVVRFCRSGWPRMPCHQSELGDITAWSFRSISGHRHTTNGQLHTSSFLSVHLAGNVGANPPFRNSLLSTEMLGFDHMNATQFSDHRHPPSCCNERQAAVHHHCRIIDHAATVWPQQAVSLSAHKWKVFLQCISSL
jgi:hypothetical protein